MTLYSHGAGHGTSQHAMSDASLPGEAVLAQGGEDHRLPAWVDSPEKLRVLAHKTTVQLQRAANRLLKRINACQMFGPGAEVEPQSRDQIGIQLLFEQRETIKALSEIAGLGPGEQVAALRSRLNGLANMQQAHQAMLSEIGRISAATNKTLIDLARVAKMADKGDDDYTDAELSQ